jgi:Domain of unknown function (DUF4062)
MTTIYLSSTYEDLKDYRQIVFDALRKSGYSVIAMEDDVATDKRPVDKCLEDIGRADIYVDSAQAGAIQPTLQEPIKDPARFPWQEVTKVAHYWLEVNAMTRPMVVREDQPPYGKRDQ